MIVIMNASCSDSDIENVFAFLHKHHLVLCQSSSERFHAACGGKGVDAEGLTPLCTPHLSNQL
ncbi:hypothetical protein KSC_035310 [Ktedonobacter sp. SOSP1-52]|nr:hypothetical protein KSC_035310 [Ktedonobacter sp. SOSP1-52]